jgi:O-methyltransferase
MGDKRVCQFETPADMPGDIVECGTWKGGSAVNLSLVRKTIRRKLRIYDSFEGLPPGELHHRQAKHYREGEYCGALGEVKLLHQLL